MAQINDFLSHIDFEAMREYCMANGETVSYAKGDCFEEAECVDGIPIHLSHIRKNLGKNPVINICLRQSHISVLTLQFESIKTSKVMNR